MQKPKRKRYFYGAISPTRIREEIVKPLFLLNSRYNTILPFLATFTYLTGGRISEVLYTRAKDITYDEVNKAFVVNLKTLKNRVIGQRQIPIARVGKDKWFYDMFEKYYYEYVIELDPDDKVFPFRSRFMANIYFKKIYIQNVLVLDMENKEWHERTIRLFPHYLRHCRASHLVSHFGFREFELMRFMGWSSSKPASFYVKLDYRDILKKMISPDILSTMFNKYLEGKL